MIMHSIPILGKMHEAQNSILSAIESFCGKTDFDDFDEIERYANFGETGSFGDIAGFGIIAHNGIFGEDERFRYIIENRCNAIDLAYFGQLEHDQALCGARMLTCENAWLAMIHDVFAGELHLLQLALHYCRSSAIRVEIHWRPGDLEDKY